MPAEELSTIVTRDLPRMRGSLLAAVSLLVPPRQVPPQTDAEQQVSALLSGSLRH